MIPKTPLLARAVKLGEDRDASVAAYDAVEGAEFTRSQVEADKFGTVWLSLAGEDRALLDEYKDAVRKELKARHNYEGTFMNVFLAGARNITTGRLWCVGSVGDNNSSGGGYNNFYSDGRLVGVAPEAQLGADVARSASPEVREVTVRGPERGALLEALVAGVKAWDPTEGPLDRTYLERVVDPLYKTQ